jgi:farnesyl-diphosphate farnesyltransferase
MQDGAGPLAPQPAGAPRDDRTARLDDLLAKTSRTFALSIPVLPEPTRREVTVAYLLFRIADTLEDATRWTPSRQRLELERFAALLEAHDDAGARALAGEWLAEPPLEHAGYLELLRETPFVTRAWADLRDEARDTVAHHTARTIERMAAFVERYDERRVLRLDDLADLRAYCYAVAGIVGEMLTELFLLSRPALSHAAPFLRRTAAQFGEALQLVNILKDSSTDAAEGRLYLPADIDRADVFALARDDVRAATHYVRELQRARAPRGVVEFCALPLMLARATLDRVEAQGPSAKLERLEVLGMVARLREQLERDALLSLDA